MVLVPRYGWLNVFYHIDMCEIFTRGAFGDSGRIVFLFIKGMDMECQDMIVIHPLSSLFNDSHYNHIISTPFSHVSNSSSYWIGRNATLRLAEPSSRCPNRLCPLVVPGHSIAGNSHHHRSQPSLSKQGVGERFVRSTTLITKPLSLEPQHLNHKSEDSVEKLQVNRDGVERRCVEKNESQRGKEHIFWWRQKCINCS